MKTINVKLDSKTITISKLPLGKYAELLAVLKTLPDRYAKFEKITQNTFLDELPTLITESLPDVVRLLEVTTPLKKEEIETLGLDEMIKVVQAIVEVNNYVEVWATAKKVIAQRQEASKPTIGSPGQ